MIRYRNIIMGLLNSVSTLSRGTFHEDIKNGIFNRISDRDSLKDISVGELKNICSQAAFEAVYEVENRSKNIVDNFYKQTDEIDHQVAEENKEL